jgi:YVTN family beta-propeller protein
VLLLAGTNTVSSAPATLTLSSVFSLVTAANPGPHGPKGIAAVSKDSSGIVSTTEVSTEIVYMQLAGTSTTLEPIVIRLSGSRSPHSIDVDESNEYASTANLRSKMKQVSQVGDSQAQQKIPRVFVGNFGSGDVSVVDLGEKKVVETIRVGRQPTALDFDPVFNKIFTTDFGDSRVSVIEYKAQGGSRVVATIDEIREPLDIQISPDGKRGYVSTQRSGVVVFDTGAASIVTRIPLPGTELRKLALSPDGRRLYVTVRTDPFVGTGQIAVIDTSSLQIIQRISAEAFPFGVTVTANGKCLVITHTVTNRVSLLDLADGQFLVASDPSAKEPQESAIIGDQAYVTNRLSDTISVFKFGEPCTQSKS